MKLELNDVQTAVSIRELSRLIENDRYPISPRIVALKEILGMMRLGPARPAPLPRAAITNRRARDGIVGVDEAIPRPTYDVESAAVVDERTPVLQWSREFLPGARFGPAFNRVGHVI